MFSNVKMWFIFSGRQGDQEFTSANLFLFVIFYYFILDTIINKAHK